MIYRKNILARYNGNLVKVIINSLNVNSRYVQIYLPIEKRLIMILLTDLDNI